MSEGKAEDKEVTRARREGFFLALFAEATLVMFSLVVWQLEGAPASIVNVAAGASGALCLAAGLLAIGGALFSRDIPS